MLDAALNIGDASANSVQPGRFSAGARRKLPGRLKLALQPFGVLKAKKGLSRATFKLWSEFRRNLNKPESSSLMRTSSAGSAFGWQKRKESDDIKPWGRQGNASARPDRRDRKWLHPPATRSPLR